MIAACFNFSGVVEKVHFMRFQEIKRRVKKAGNFT